MRNSLAFSVITDKLVQSVKWLWAGWPVFNS